jgi:hypothetical protein
MEGAAFTHEPNLLVRGKHDEAGVHLIGMSIFTFHEHC